MSPHLSVVIPLYNEEENIAPLQQQLQHGLAGQSYEILFVDDGSKDRTVEKIQRSATVRVLAFEKMQAKARRCMPALWRQKATSLSSSMAICKTIRRTS